MPISQECSLALKNTYAGDGFDDSPLAAALQRLIWTSKALTAGQRPPPAVWQEISDDLLEAGQAVQKAQQEEETLGVNAQRAAADAFLRWLRELEGGKSVSDDSGKLQ